jgi:hypothetical protein
MRVDRVDMGAGVINATKHKGSGYVTLVLEKHLLEHGQSGINAGLAAGGESVKLKLRADESCSLYIAKG